MATGINPISSFSYLVYLAGASTQISIAHKWSLVSRFTWRALISTFAFPLLLKSYHEFSADLLIDLLSFQLKYKEFRTLLWGMLVYC